MRQFFNLCLLSAGSALLADESRVQPQSGYAFMEPSTQQLQDDDFLNPAFFLVEEGLALWNQEWPAQGGGTRSCRSCHGDPETSMRGVAARYPAYDPVRGGAVNMEIKLLQEITEKLGAPAPDYESQDLLALTALVAFQSRGIPMALPDDAHLQGWIDRGAWIFNTRLGQLNLSCAQCHQDHWGERLRGDTISQGQVNAFPIFRLTWGEVGSRHRMFTWCMEAVRAEPFAFGSDDYVALETFLVHRGEGLLIEAPGVRR